ncbi:MAG: sugar transferase [Clostridia bacterium]|nr:sugar transferase [Clostridia bacterium]
MYKKYVKRFLDIVISLFALIVLSPVMLIVAILVRIKLGSPVIFKQERPGKDGKIFKLYKFRSMSDKKDENGKLLPDAERLTKFGKILRATSLDELPELVNILKGEMSLIGPRPLAVCYLPFYNETEKHRHDVRPGLTGLAQVNGRNALNWEDRFAYDIEYVNNITFINDVKILFKTVYKVFKRDGVVTRGTGKTIDFDVYRKEQLENNKKDEEQK